MSGHYICDRCGYDGLCADYCVTRRPVKDRWQGHYTKEEMEELRRASQLPSQDRVTAK